MIKKRIYLDYAAATPLDTRVKEEMEKAEKFFGNASSIHSEGSKAKEILEEARKKIAGILGCKSGEIIFTSGGTESDNLAIFGIARKFKKGHIITTKIEHSAVLEPCRQLEKEGFEVTYLPPDKNGFINPEDIKKSLREDTILISVIYANNEIGTIQPIRQISKIKGKAYFHTDACQAAGFLNLKVETLGVDLLTLNAAKIYGPKGIGILYKKSDVKISPLIYGGGQEGGLRSGTESPVLYAGLAEALVLAQENKENGSRRLSDLRDYFIKMVLTEIPNTELNGSSKNRLPNNANFHFKDCNSEELLIKLDLKGIACSSASACSATLCTSSHVIAALNKKNNAETQSLRFSLGRHTNKKDLDYVIKVLCEILKN